MVESSNTVGYSTLATLHEQHEQIKGLDRDLTKIDGFVRRSGILVSEYAKALATDRICQGLTFINIGLVVAIIIYIILYKI
jgi:hypothetical protein